MSTPAPNSNETSTGEEIRKNDLDESIRARLPRSYGSDPPAETPPSPPEPAVTSQPVESKRTRWGSGLLPAFWTVASIISITVNIILLAILLSLWPLRGTLQKTADDQVSGLLGGLYQNFVKMDQATITKTISVDANIPLKIEVPVQATTRIFLAEPAVIQSPRVVMRTGGLILDAPAMVTLPAGTPLTVSLDFPLTVENTIPVHLDVPVSIPLNETQLHEPFVGLQQVVEPWYCLVEPDAQVDGVPVCSPKENAASTGTDAP